MSIGNENFSVMCSTSGIPTGMRIVYSKDSNILFHKFNITYVKIHDSPFDFYRIKLKEDINYFIESKHVNVMFELLDAYSTLKRL